MTELLRLDGVRKSFGDHVVLREVDLTIEPGQCVVLIGASGSGKSTLLRCVNLLEVVDDGVITFEGRDITDPRVDGDEVRSRMGMVFQAYNLFPHLDVIGNVTLALRAGARRRRRGGAVRAGWRCWTGWASPRRRRRAPTTCPAGSSSGWRSRGRWWPTRG